MRFDFLARERADDEHGKAFHAGNALAFVGQGLDGDDEIVVFLNGRAHFLCHRFGILSARVARGRFRFWDFVHWNCLFMLDACFCALAT